MSNLGNNITVKTSAFLLLSTVASGLYAIDLITVYEQALINLDKSVKRGKDM